MKRVTLFLTTFFFFFLTTACSEYATKDSHKKSHPGCSSHLCDYTAIQNVVEKIKLINPNLTYEDIKKDDFDFKKLRLREIEETIVSNYIKNYELKNQKIGYYPKTIESYLERLAASK